MTTAQHLAAIDLLRGRPFPAQRERSQLGDSGPGYHLARLRTPADGLDASDRTAGRSREPYEAECEALVAALSSRWGQGQWFALWSVFIGSICGEEIPQPWEELSHCVEDLHMWRVGSHWTAVGVSRAEGEDEYRLIAVVTDVDPP
ncbi:hypothetical protein [Streptomyces peucetius]|uniref:Barstar (barnase inhibitor) domain-containing protein n=1 Tax=Streptomyces peucetius TaxID=1950 RepID=A0ABY6I1L3_STRPE|nr:hypothetical protein [Streptomyces peucetius]UYQ60867.1 hypothetical protein OGH68_04875 [Streptomyces peucetius]